MEEAEQERTTTREAAPRPSKATLQRPVAVGAEVSGDGALEPRPRAFDGVELRCIGGQANQREPRLLVCERERLSAAMGIHAVPEDDEGSAVVPVETPQEPDDVLGTNGSGHQAEEEPRATSVRRVRNGADRRKMLPVAEAVPQDGRLPPRRPGPLDRGTLREAALVDEDERCGLGRGVFFTAGQVVLTQRSIAASSRSRARVVGFCRDQPCFRSNRHTWPG